MSLLDQPHRRFNPLTGRWVLISAERTRRPWQGAVEADPKGPRPAYDPQCYLCPGNERAGGARNPAYDRTYVFTNDFPALVPDTAAGLEEAHPLLRAQGQPGTSRVLCFSPRHDLTLAMMPPADVRSVVDLWASQVAELSADYPWVQLFENRGAMMGASNPHPHGQLWATRTVPDEPAHEDARQGRWHTERGKPLLLEYAEVEAQRGERVVAANAHWLVVVPFWAVWPFETLVVPRAPVQRLPELSDERRDALAGALSALLIRYDNLFGVPFPYSMGWHGAPGAGGDAPHWQLHAHFYPPLLRSATVRKHMVGYEMLGEPQRDVSTEEAAQRLREQSPVHWSTAGGGQA
ncbi:MAG TPA: UDP-glucose--hexose-1-phosphate uridylyltransferase [Egibacteraceae bacterium]|nr:UDP-glucose--hexose-1-phosphate uridylyltransferase [Egibacteraceae bacterium]